MNLPFGKYQIEKFIRYNGTHYTLTLPKLNQFREPEGEDTTYKLRGVYHESHTYLKESSSDGGTVRSKTSPYILCSHIHYPNIKVGMRVRIGNTLYRVTGVQDLNHLNVACDISIEEVLYEQD